MALSTKPSSKSDPYCGFKDDRQRRLALLVRECCYTVTALGVAFIASGKIQWLINWFH